MAFESRLAVDVAIQRKLVQITTPPDRCSPGLAADRAHEFEFSHQAGHTVAADLDALAAELAPDLLGAVDIEVLSVHPSDLDLELLVAQPARRRWSPDRSVISRRVDLQRLADRLD